MDTGTGCAPVLPLEMLKKAVLEVTVDPSFQVPCLLASSAKKAAFDFAEWMEASENTRKMETFSNDVVAELNKAFLCTAARQQTKREKMWGLYTCYVLGQLSLAR